MKIKKSNKISEKDNVVFLINAEKQLDKACFAKSELAYIKKCLKAEMKQIHINQYEKNIFVVFVENKGEKYKVDEKCRIAASKLVDTLNQKKVTDIVLTSTTENLLAFAEGMVLANYQFLKYYTDKKVNTLKSIAIVGDVKANEITELNEVLTATHIAKDLVNEPVSYLNAVQYGKDIKKLGKEAGFKVEVLNKAKIEALKMGGLLAVNQGSVTPPTFSILEWKPKNAKNKKPIVLVGKGVVYDTGGLSLKPTPNSMDLMKCDMGGSAAVIGGLYAIAKNKLPVYVIGLIPATDNRPGGNAYAPGDVITMHNKTTVEVLNTDAEGRMVLADALSYADKYKPELVIDIATLTGAAVAAIGHYGMVGMGNADEKTFKKLQKSGETVYERVVEFPFWEEYDEQLKSTIADLKNIGKGAGTITAGKFLAHFTDYPYIHLDIAGPAFINKKINYLSNGATGVGVRLFYDFLKNY